MNSDSAELLALWVSHHPDTPKIPGIASPEDGKCNSKLRDKRLKELSLERFCSKSAGYGTDHPGIGSCKWHLGRTQTHIAAATRTSMVREFGSLSLELANPEIMGPPEIEALKLASKMLTWSNFLESKMGEFQDALYTEDKSGVEHARAIIELMERSHERLQKSLEFLLKYDLRKRVVELEERQAEVIGAAFMRIVSDTDLHLTEAQFSLACMMFAREINLLGADLAPSWMKGVLTAEPDESEIVDAEVIE